MKNLFGKLPSLIVERLKVKPAMSTWTAALLLSGTWTMAWLIVFFLSTWLFDLSTKPSDFINIFWLSISAEAAIRWAENTKFVASLAKPNCKQPTGDNQDYSVSRAALLVFASLVAMFFFDTMIDQTGFKGNLGMFIGQQGARSPEALAEMWNYWWTVAAQLPVWLPMAVGTILRALIYKRSHAPRDVLRLVENRGPP